MNQKRILTTGEKITFAIMFFLLFVRITDKYLVIWLFNGVKPAWYDYSYFAGGYFLIAIAIWINKKNVKNLHITKNFIRIFIFAGIFVSLLLVPAWVGLVSGIATLIILKECYSGGFVFDAREPNPRTIWEMVFLFVLNLSVFITVLASFIVTPRAISWNMDSILSALYYADLPVILYEEVLFRGMLWMFLSSLNMSDRRIFYIQAFLFWISHYYYFSHPYTFWVTMPLTALILGLMVWRSKSLVSSSIAHFLVNALISLLSKV